MVKLSGNQRRRLEELWFIYGNRREKHTMGNHKFIQNILEWGEDNRKLYLRGKGDWKLTKECINEVDKILCERRQ